MQIQALSAATCTIRPRHAAAAAISSISSRARAVLGGKPRRHSRAATGSATGRRRNGSSAMTAAITNVLPRETFFPPLGTFSDPS